MSDIPEKPRHFIQQIIDQDLKNNTYGGKVITRFPPEPNGYLHIGHAKSICLNFGLAQEYNATCHLRFDDTNPINEEQEFVDAIKRDVQWLGFDWQEKLFFTSDYFEQLYQFAVELIKNDKAYVEELSAEDIRAYRGTLKESGKNSPFRDRPVEESLDLFTRMRAGEFADGQYVVRAKIDMQSGNMNMRDPVIYRIRHAHHQRTGDTWCVYPMYDFAHSLSDAIENISHSICTIEFQDHRPLYNWCVENVNCEGHPQQIEFARLNLSHTITSKRKLKSLVTDGLVTGWDDPRMPTLIGVRRRGFPAKAIRRFCNETGVSKSNSILDMGLLEESVRDELNDTAPRAFCVQKPLKIVIENYPEGQSETLKAPIHPQNQDMGERELTFTRELFIEQDDFMLEAPKKFFRLAPGKEVRLRYSYVIRCESVITDPATGDITELRCTYDPDTLGKKPEGRKVKGVIHWLDASTAQEAEVRLYDRLFTEENPAALEDFTTAINPDALVTLHHCLVEPTLAHATAEASFQFERLGYYCVDNKDSQPGHLVFNRVIGLRSTWQ